MKLRKACDCGESHNEDTPPEAENGVAQNVLRHDVNDMGNLTSSGPTGGLCCYGCTGFVEGSDADMVGVGAASRGSSSFDSYNDMAF